MTTSIQKQDNHAIRSSGVKSKFSGNNMSKFFEATGHVAEALCPGDMHGESTYT